ncbi:MAG: GGDEF domain-containing protein [Henriciella sp.]
MQTQILGLVTPLMAIFFAVTFFMLWKMGGLKRHVLGFGIAFALSAIGFLITHVLPADTFYVFHATQLFYALGSILMLLCACERVGQRPPLASFAIVYLFSAVVLALMVSFTNDVGPRLVLINIGYGVMFALGVMVLLNAPHRSKLDIAIIAIMAFQAADFLIRPSLTLMYESSIPAEAYRDTIYYSLIGLVLGIKGVTTAMVLIGATIADWMTALRESSERDPQTGLFNRASFEETMRNLLRRTQTEGRPLSLIVADIDFFKRVNDTWGHQAGDQVISKFGSLIARMIRDYDTAGRIGGEEFCIAVWDCESDPAHRLADRIRLAFAELEHSELKDNIRLTASFGIATAHEGETYAQLFARADNALYLAKSKGRDRVENAERQGITQDVASSNPRMVELELALNKRAVS